MIDNNKSHDRFVLRNLTLCGHETIILSRGYAMHIDMCLHSGYCMCGHFCLLGMYCVVIIMSAQYTLHGQVRWVPHPLGHCVYIC